MEYDECHGSFHKRGGMFSNMLPAHCYEEKDNDDDGDDGDDDGDQDDDDNLV